MRNVLFWCRFLSDVLFAAFVNWARRPLQGRYVFVSAPGVDVMVVSTNDKVRMESGTSYGAAIFTGIAALVVEKYGKMDRVGFTAIIEESAKDLGAPGRDKVYGVGLVQVRAILSRGK